MEKPRLLLTRRWPSVVEAALKDDFGLVLNDNDKPFSPCERSNGAVAADAILPTVTDQMSADILSVRKPKAKILANYGVGFSHIVGEAANKAGDVQSACTADLAITLMLMLKLSQRAQAAERQAQTSSRHDGPPHFKGAEASRQTLGIIGFGRIGQEVAKRAHHEFGMSIVVYNPSPVANEILNAVNAKFVTSIDELLPQADFVSLHCPGGQSNHRMIDQRRLNLMKPTAFLINAARRELVDEHALQQSLWFETIAGAGLHVYPDEPQISSGLTACDNAIVLPHIGNATSEPRIAMEFRVAKNLKAFFAGNPLPDIVH